ncbi:DUF262 domain-containing protein (plasmid) [Rathayibacter sp. VKM Ac-2759]|uniref:GmrSD restriction endonuclease domain-containing protein n=1 Tax=Rathayibacter sp. VKM Ac-2759 TaxID=2609252 RepID=UPI001317CBFF|nr:DUF262 domain-containing protein [Rathayibacter sp. VKM Ac-2759]QHC68924.1 DUF262 domain-containing protein [Rathayibacter sp. VKM Ac-2759]
MLTQVRSPQEVFFAPQRFVLPLFQRPYVWSAELQWEPLWQDITRLVEVVSERPEATHFMGAIVLQQQQVPLGELQAWSVIDGQQRLTTLQLLLDALHAELTIRDWAPIAGQVVDLVENSEAFRSTPEDQFKLWPTNRDRASFSAVMRATPPVVHHGFEQSRLVQGHQYFTDAIATWLDAAENPQRAARTLVAAITTKLQLVVIQLQADEDAQEIFETLNARGTPLSAADLIKNFVFQRLNASAAATEQAYQQWWAQFETPFWETEVRAGRLIYTRSSLFLTQWLTARTMREIPAREVFTAFKRYASDPASGGVERLLPEIHAAATRYREFTEQALLRDGLLSRLALFVYRTGTLDSELAKPLLIWLGEPEQADIPAAERDRLLAVLESWFVRRALVRAPSQGANRFLLDLLTHLLSQPHERIAATAETFLTKQSSGVGFWPDDADVLHELSTVQAYKRFRRARLRMILEAVEDHLRGYPDGHRYGEGPVARGTHTIEHIMPQEWRANWGGLSEHADADRDRIVQTLGNLTLATQPLNSRLSNAGWVGENGKRRTLERYSSLLLTRPVVNEHPDDWNDDDIAARTRTMIDVIARVWPVPAGHRTQQEVSVERAVHRIEVADLVRAGLLAAGATLRARPAASAGRTATVGQDGSIHLDDGTVHATLSGAAKATSGNIAEAGWHFWSHEDGTTLTETRAEYLSGTDDERIDEDA